MTRTSCSDILPYDGSLLLQVAELPKAFPTSALVSYSLLVPLHIPFQTCLHSSTPLLKRFLAGVLVAIADHPSPQLLSSSRDKPAFLSLQLAPESQ